MEDFYYKDYSTGNVNPYCYKVYYGDGTLLEDTFLTKKMAMVLVSALNNFILIAYSEKSLFTAKDVAQMFLSDIVALKDW